MTEHHLKISSFSPKGSCSFTRIKSLGERVENPPNYWFMYLSVFFFLKINIVTLFQKGDFKAMLDDKKLKTKIEKWDFLTFFDFQTNWLWCIVTNPEKSKLKPPIQ